MFACSFLRVCVRAFAFVCLSLCACGSCACARVLVAVGVYFHVNLAYLHVRSPTFGVARKSADVLNSVSDCALITPVSDHPA